MGNNSSLFFIFFSTVLFIAFVLQKQHQLSSSLDQLSSSLDQLNSKVSLLESIIKKSDHQLRSKEEDIAVIKKMILEKEEVKTVQQNIVYKIDLDQEWIPALKIQFLNFISKLKHHLDFPTSKISEVSKVSNTLVTFVEKLQKSATTFIKELYKSVIPYIMKMSMWLLSELVKGLNTFFQFCLEAAR
ncbi:unnamed protein product [Trifolium pratense]|uniref:Uncharacterized protein n=1 Tax=Trifolium pratense TaxID=57577 RepID=A0ACB0J129_TRIPR|nr:unnamed protein product [Trifolium pratense]